MSGMSVTKKVRQGRGATIGVGKYRVPGGLVLVLKKYEITPAQLAEILDIRRQSAYRKLAGHTDWTYRDLWRVAESLNVPIKSLVD